MPISTTDFAHIEPFAKVKKHTVSNIVALCPNHHTLFDKKKMIDRKAVKVYKLKLQFLNKRYTKYELRLLMVLADKQFVLASGEIETMGLLNDGLIENAKTLMFNRISLTDEETGARTFEAEFVQAFAANLLPKVANLLAYGNPLRTIYLIPYDVRIPKTI